MVKNDECILPTYTRNLAWAIIELVERHARQQGDGKVTTLRPQLRGAWQRGARSPLRDQANSGRSEAFVPRSSTNTRRSAPLCSPRA